MKKNILHPLQRGKVPISLFEMKSLYIRGKGNRNLSWSCEWCMNQALIELSAFIRWKTLREGQGNGHLMSIYCVTGVVYFHIAHLILIVIIIDRYCTPLISAEDEETKT